MTNEQLTKLTNIIGGVESGGQTYGNRNYAAYAGPKANTANEVTCTLGWAQNYANEGRRLCRNILTTDPVGFRKADTANIEAKLSVDWKATKWNPTTAQKNALIAIITTDAGKRCQDELFQELMSQYEKEAIDYGVTSIQAIMMWCEIEHLGGLGPTKRIFDRVIKPYTPDSIFASLMKDQQDTTNNNQVGDKLFQSRHECCVRWIKQYVTDGAASTTKEEPSMTEKELRQKYVDVMNGWIGLDRAKGTHKPIIDTYNAHKPLARNYKVTYSDAYCAATVSAAAIICGLTDIIPTECGCGDQIALFKKLGRWVENDAYVPQIGDIVYYDWDDNGVGDCTGWPEHVGVVAKISGTTLTITEGNMSGKVGQRTIQVNARYIRGYGIPDFASKATSAGGGSTSGGNTSGGTSSGASTSPNRTPKWVGKVTAKLLNVRSWAGVENATIKSWPQLAQGNLVDVCDSLKAKDGSTWYYVRIDGRIYGFVHSDYIKKV